MRYAGWAGLFGNQAILLALILCTSSGVLAGNCSREGVVSVFEDFELVDLPLAMSSKQHLRLWRDSGRVQCPTHGEDTLDISEPTIYFEQGRVDQRFAVTVPDPAPADSYNKVLLFQLNQPNVNMAKGVSKGRVQLSVYDNVGVMEMKSSSRMFLGRGFQRLVESRQAISWLTIAEFWSDPVWNRGRYPFRISVDLTRPAHSNQDGFYIRVRAQEYDHALRRWSQPLWESQSAEPVVPVGAWLSIVYLVRSSPQDGMFEVAVGSEADALIEVINVRGATVDPREGLGRGLTHFNPLKLYTEKATVDLVSDHGESLSIYWDDLEITGCAQFDHAACRLKTGAGSGN